MSKSSTWIHIYPHPVYTWPEGDCLYVDNKHPITLNNSLTKEQRPVF